MASLLYVAVTALDGFVADRTGKFDWAVPDDEVHAFINDMMRPIGTYLYGRRMYETMAGWETMETDPGSLADDFAKIWRAAEKVVYSTTLPATYTSKTKLARSFDAHEIELRKHRSPSDLAVAGPDLAGHAFRAGIIDRCRLFLAPVLVGAGRRALPRDVHLELTLENQRCSNAASFTSTIW
ncbi:MAG: dihydrofolate reductase family protein [Candidatus Cybelea sp.]